MPFVPVTITPSAGDGSTTVFTLATSPTSINVFLDGLRVYPTAYVFVSGGNKISFLSAPPQFSGLFVEGST